MKTVEVHIYGRTCHLRLTSAALYDIYEHFGKDKSAFENIEGTDKAAFDAICWYFAKLSEQGELSRRMQGHEARDIITKEDVKVLLTPGDFPAAKLAVLRAMQQGFGREVPLAEEVTVLGTPERYCSRLAVIREDEILSGEAFTQALSQALEDLAEDPDWLRLAGAEHFAPLTEDSLDALRRLITIEG